MLTLPEVRVGDPLRHEALTVFPLFDPAKGSADYLLSDEALAAGVVTVEEVGIPGPCRPSSSTTRANLSSCSSKGRNCEGRSRTGC